MKKVLKISKTLISIVLFLGLIVGIIGSNRKIAYAEGETNTSSEYVNTITDLKTTDLIGNATLYEQKMTSLLNGDPAKRWQEHFVQWVDLANYDAMKVVTWTNQSIDNWTAVTTRKAAEDWEANHPGWIVVAGINGDFFRNSGSCTYEPTNNFMADGDMYRADYVGGVRKIVGFTEDNEVVVGDPDLTDLMKLYIYSEDGALSEKLDIAGYNQNPSETGITLYTKDAPTKYNLEGYTVYVGKYTICRVADDGKNTVFVKGEIQSSRDGTSSERPNMTIEVENEDGSKSEKYVREFYLATKDPVYAEKLAQGTEVKCQYDYEGQWSEVTQSIGYNWEILLDGQAQQQYSTEGHVNTDHPRTFIGFKEDNTPVIMVIDGRGKEDNKGVSLFEGGEIMKLAGCVNAYNLDGGGSSTLLVRNDSGSFQVINRPSDGNERSTGNALFFVMREPAVSSSIFKSTSTSITIDKKTTNYAKKITDLVISVNGKDYPMEGETLTINNLMPNRKHDVKVTYKYEGEECVAVINGYTKEYNPGLIINPVHDGFVIKRPETTDVLRIKEATIRIDENTYELSEDLEQLRIKGLFKDTEYQVSYTYKAENIETKEIYESFVEPGTYFTTAYEIPSIEKFELASSNEVSGRAAFNYKYRDPDNFATKAYILINNEAQKELTSKSGYISLTDLELGKIDYEFKIVLEYEVNGNNDKEYSETIKIAKHVHTWDEATCEAPKTCTDCGETEGTSLGHEWSEATCENPKTCTRCNKTEGSKLQHSWTDATSDAPKTCTKCGETEGEPLPKKKGCKKSSLASIILSIGLVTSALYLIRRKK